jgi:hypothetical protein
MSVSISQLLYIFLSFGSTAKFWALAASMKLPVSFRLLDLGQSAGLLGRVISSSQTLYLHNERINYGFIHAIYRQNGLLLTCALNVYVNPSSMMFRSSRSREIFCSLKVRSFAKWR